MRKVLVVLVSAMCLGACSTMDTPYDPNIYKGQTLFELFGGMILLVNGEETA